MEDPIDTWMRTGSSRILGHLQWHQKVLTKKTKGLPNKCANIGGCHTWRPQWLRRPWTLVIWVFVRKQPQPNERFHPDKTGRSCLNPIPPSWNIPVLSCLKRSQICSFIPQGFWVIFFVGLPGDAIHGEECSTAMLVGITDSFSLFWWLFSSKVTQLWNMSHICI